MKHSGDAVRPNGNFIIDNSRKKLLSFNFWLQIECGASNHHNIPY